MTKRMGDFQNNQGESAIKIIAIGLVILVAVKLRDAGEWVLGAFKGEA